MRKILSVAAILIVIPALLYGVAEWVYFWVNRSIGEWFAFGMGIPLALIVALWFIIDTRRTKETGQE